MSFKSDMRRFARDLRVAEASDIRHISTSTWYTAPIPWLHKPACGCLFGGTLVANGCDLPSPLHTDLVESRIEDEYPSFGLWSDEITPAALISVASEIDGVDFALMADFIDGTPDWALEEYEQ